MVIFSTLFTIYSRKKTFREMWIIIKDVEQKKSSEALFGVFSFDPKSTIANVYLISVVLFFLLTVLGNINQCSRYNVQKKLKQPYPKCFDNWKCFSTVFESRQVKQNVICSITNFICELSYNLLNDRSDLGKKKNQQVLRIGWFPCGKDTSATEIESFVKAVVKVCCCCSILVV